MITFVFNLLQYSSQERLLNLYTANSSINVCKRERGKITRKKHSWIFKITLPNIEGSGKYFTSYNIPGYHNWSTTHFLMMIQTIPSSVLHLLTAQVQVYMYCPLKFCFTDFVYMQKAPGVNYKVYLTSLIIPNTWICWKTFLVNTILSHVIIMMTVIIIIIKKNDQVCLAVGSLVTRFLWSHLCIKIMNKTKPEWIIHIPAAYRLNFANYFSLRRCKERYNTTAKCEITLSLSSLT